MQKNTLTELAKESLYLRDASREVWEAKSKNHFEKANQFLFFVNNFVNKNESVQLADSYVEKFSEKKELNDYKTSFKIESVVYVKENGDFSDNGTMTFEFEIVSAKGLRNISKREIFNFWVDEQNKEILFMLHGKGYSEKNMNIVHIGFETMTVNVIEDNRYDNNAAPKPKKGVYVHN